MKQDTSGAFTLLQTGKNTSETEKQPTKTKIMKQKLNRIGTSAGLFAAALLLTTLNAQRSTLFAQGTAFAYQGALNQNGSAFTGSAEFQPTLWDAASAGNQVASNNPVSVVVSVTNGLFVLPLDFADSFPGSDRWLQLQVRTDIGPFTTLSPRQKLTPTPYAVHSANAATATVAASANSVAAANITGNPSSPNPSCQFCVHDESTSSKTRKTAAPITGPQTVVMPPSTHMTTRSPERTHDMSAGLMNC